MTFAAIARWEMRHYLRRISTWVYVAVFFALGLLFTLVLGGAFPELSAALATGGRVHANSPYSLATLLPVLALFGVSITAALVGNALHRDFAARIDPLLYTTPLRRRDFLGGKFAGAVAINALVLLGLGLGSITGALSPWVDAGRIGVVRLAVYAQVYAILLLPNLLFVSAIFFALVALTRQMLPNYIGGAVLLIGYLVASLLVGNIDSPVVGGLLDPFGLSAIEAATRYWTISEKNERMVPFTGVFLANRVLWLGMGAGVLAVAARRFRFAYQAPARFEFDATSALPVPDVAGEAPLRLDRMPAVTRRTDALGALAQYRSMVTRALWRVLGSPYFVVVVMAGLLYVAVAAEAAGELYGTATWPVTYQMVEILEGTFGLFILVILAFYGGEIVWAERDARMDQLQDASPVGTATTVLAKTTALLLVLAVLLGVTIIAGVVLQVTRGYYHFELGLYLQALLGMNLLDFGLVAVLVVAVHVILDHKYLAHLAITLFVVGIGVLSTVGVEHNLYQYGDDGGATYSDMNGWGPFLGPYLWWKAYWSAFAALLLVATTLFWVRGQPVPWRERVSLARRRAGPRARIVAAAAGVLFVSLGGFLYYNTNVLNTYRTTREDRTLRVERERLYSRYARLPQPRIAAIDVAIDLFPETGGITVRGSYRLVNRTDRAIDTLALGISEMMTVDSLDFDRPSVRLVDDPPRDFHLVRLERPIAPGDSAVMRFALGHRPRGFPNEIVNTFVVSNGSFVPSSIIMPAIGYQPGAEVTDEDVRQREGLPSRPTMPAPTDPGVRERNYATPDADWISLNAVVSTNDDQVALVSGRLLREWRADGHRFFQYRLDGPSLNFWAVQSARYEIARSRWDGVAIDVLHHPGHGANVPTMIAAVQQALAYNSRAFAPYQHAQLRISEFPRYAAFAQSLPDIVPYSEALGFIARLEDSTDIDYPFYVTAHEVAHQWWAHQVISANAQGATMLSETLAQYSALMVMEDHFGPLRMRRFLQYELDTYLRGRSAESQREHPLVRVEQQPYIHYNKGALAMYALRDYLGEDRVNAVLRAFLAEYRFRGPPYPLASDLVNRFRAAAPDSLAGLVDDLFTRITLYELRADSALVVDSAGGRFAVDLHVTARKLEADSLGRETERSFADWIDVGAFRARRAGEALADPNGTVLRLEKHRITPGAQRIRLELRERPTRLGIDPLHKLIDRRIGDNTVGVQWRIGRAAPR